jgi:hypothetical protein
MLTLEFLLVIFYVLKGGGGVHPYNEINAR